MTSIIFFDIDDVLFKTDLFIESGLNKYEPYEDAKIVEEVSQKIEIGILSKGDYNLQIDKLSKTGLLKFFKKENIFIVEEKNEITKKIFKKFKDKVIYVLDDRIDNLNKIKKTFAKSKTILIKRGRYQSLNNDYNPDFIINNLKELFKII